MSRSPARTNRPARRVGNHTGSVRGVSPGWHGYHAVHDPPESQVGALDNPDHGGVDGAWRRHRDELRYTGEEARAEDRASLCNRRPAVPSRNVRAARAVHRGRQPGPGPAERRRDLPGDAGGNQVRAEDHRLRNLHLLVGRYRAAVCRRPFGASEGRRRSQSRDRLGRQHQDRGRAPRAVPSRPASRSACTGHSSGTTSAA